MSYKLFQKQREIYVLISIFTILIYSTILYIYHQSGLKFKSGDISFHTSKQTIKHANFKINKVVNVKNNKLKYILIWTYNNTEPFMYLQNGQKSFIQAKCEYKNCFVTNDKSYFPNLSQMDAILFHAPEFTYWRRHRFPNERSPHQKYILASIESADNYPSCSEDFYNYFNWTWTYKLNSDVSWGYIKIRDKKSGKIIGPNENISWEKNMTDLSIDQKESLKSKKKAAAWFVSNCYTRSRREYVVRKLHESLKKYGLNIDIYGKCGTFACEHNKGKCWEKLKNDYFFYLAFENSFSEDYVTEKFLHGMKHWTVPIVWGGANYSMFAPPGSYIDVSEIKNSKKIAKLIYSSMKNISEYASYFRWRNYYSYQKGDETPDTNAFCALCKALNDPVMMSTHKSYSDFNSWWNTNITNRCNKKLKKP